MSFTNCGLIVVELEVGSSSNPWGPVMSTRKPRLNGSAAIQASCGPSACLPPRDDGRFDALATVAGDSFDVEDRERHAVQLWRRRDDKKARQYAASLLISVVKLKAAPITGREAWALLRSFRNDGTRMRTVHPYRDSMRAITGEWHGYRDA
jgi:hypothetical protein